MAGVNSVLSFGMDFFYHSITLRTSSTYHFYYRSKETTELGLIVANPFHVVRTEAAHSKGRDPQQAMGPSASGLSRDLVILGQG